MQIIITGRNLSPAARQRINRAASDEQPIYEHSYVHTGRNRYAPVIEGGYEHAVARHMMVVAGTTFDYEIVN